MISAGILGATGYAGAELARLLYHHPRVRVTSVASIEGVGQRLGEYFPHLWPFDLTIKEELGEVEVVFAALPHAVAAKLLLPFIDRGLPVIDLSADFRLKDVSVYESWYNTTHPRPQLLQEAVYGLPELHREEIVGCQLVANPGCYPTSAILALAPAVKAGLIEGDVVVDSKSGASGAGRSPGLTTQLAEAGEGISAYALGRPPPSAGDRAGAGASRRGAGAAGDVRPSSPADGAGHPQHLLRAIGCGSRRRSGGAREGGAAGVRGFLQR